MAKREHVQVYVCFLCTFNMHVCTSVDIIADPFGLPGCSKPVQEGVYRVSQACIGKCRAQAWFMEGCSQKAFQLGLQPVMFPSESR